MSPICRVDIAIINASFSSTDLDQRFDALGLKAGVAGAIVTFIGQVRQSGDHPDVTGLVLEHYAGMTEHVLQQHVANACARWELLGIVLVHRVGEMHLGENIVGVVVASAHRQVAFEAVQYLMDFLKNDAPFWKQELTDQGAEWVEQKATDLDKAKRW
ncbi:MAG: molybdenum cofactor biosynthesis protein MoaE [Candidatus Saccharibacteria bacterium]|nr:molybdenum cofactor biosynthesis protein MoaE [Moraxellaceae bacterium]